jgi:predicted transcriptional regulator
MRRRRKLSQRDLAKKLKVPQPHVARTERLSHDPRISSIVKAAKAVHCHVMLVPDEYYHLIHS